VGQRACESFMKTLKYEEVLRNEYRNLAEARSSIREFPRKSLQPETLALGARLPAAGRVRGQPVAERKGGRCAAACPNEFFKAWGNLSIRC
jgi:hypothetical protein